MKQSTDAEALKILAILGNLVNNPAVAEAAKKLAIAREECALKPVVNVQEAYSSFWDTVQNVHSAYEFDEVKNSNG